VLRATDTRPSDDSAGGGRGPLAEATNVPEDDRALKANKRADSNQLTFPVREDQPVTRRRHGSRTKAAEFIRQEIASEIYRPSGAVEIETRPAVWTLAHKGYSGAGRLDVWVYRDEDSALREGAKLALECGLDEHLAVVSLYKRKKYAEILERYELERPGHVLRVQSSFFVLDD
jgi:hypothetical protein